MTDSGVNRATEKLFRIVTTPDAMLKLGETKLKDHIKTVNLNNNEYLATVGKLPAGEYAYVYRFRLTDGPYCYGDVDGAGSNVAQFRRGGVSPTKGRITPPAPAPDR